MDSGRLRSHSRREVHDDERLATPLGIRCPLMLPERRTVTKPSASVSTRTTRRLTARVSPMWSMRFPAWSWNAGVNPLTLRLCAEERNVHSKTSARAKHESPAESLCFLYSACRLVTFRLVCPWPRCAALAHLPANVCHPRKLREPKEAGHNCPFLHRYLEYSE